MGDVEGLRSIDVEVYKALRAHELELNKATAAFEHGVIGPLYLMNGGAVVAFLALLGAAAGEGSTLTVRTGWAVSATLLWAAGLLAATWAARQGWEAQRAFTKAERMSRQAAEASLITAASPLHGVVVGTTVPCQADVDGARRSAKRAQEAFRRSSAGSVVLFLVGAGAGAAAVL